MSKVFRSPIAFLAGIGLFAFGAIHFARLAILPRIPAKMRGA